MQRLANSVCGSLVPTIQGQLAYVPDPLPRELSLSPGVVSLLDRASRAIATLSGVGETIQNPHLLIRPLLRWEAVLSSRIEGTRASLTDVFSYEVGNAQSASGDVREVVNYVLALERGIESLDTLPISLRLINEMHEQLLDGVRGGFLRTGEFRQDQVWIGFPGSTIRDAIFVPPPPDRLMDLFADWERFMNEPIEMPPLVRCALMHYQIEAIHPFEDGNGRIGRLLITLFLIASGVLRTPLLYLSAYFERDRRSYYDELLAVSVGCDWERWLRYFLMGVLVESRDALERIRRIRGLQDRYRELLEQRRASISALRLIEMMFAQPIITIRVASELLGMSISGARGVLNQLVSAGLVRHDGQTWPPLYVADEIMAVLQEPVSLRNF